MISASLVGSGGIIQLPLTIRQIRYGQYGLAQIIAEVPNYKLYSTTLLLQDDVYFIELFDGLTTEKARVDTIELSGSVLKITALGPIASLTDNNLYNRFWLSTSLENWSPILNTQLRTAGSGLILQEDFIILNQQRGLNITMEAGASLSFTNMNAYIFSSFYQDIKVIGFDCEGFLQNPMGIFIEYLTQNYTFITNTVLLRPPTTLNVFLDDTFYIFPPANTRHITFMLYASAAYTVPGFTGFYYGRLLNAFVSTTNTNLVDTTINTAITTIGTQFVTPASMNNIVIGMTLFVDPATSTSDSLDNGETIKVTNITSTQFEANFQRTHSANRPLKGVLVSPSDIIDNVVSFSRSSNFRPNHDETWTQSGILVNQTMVGDENIAVGSTGKDIIDRLTSQYGNNFVFTVSNSNALYATKGFYSTTYKALVTNVSLSTRLSTLRTGAQVAYKTEEGFDRITDIIATFSNTRLLDQYELLLGSASTTDTTDVNVATKIAQNILSANSEIQPVLTFDIVTLFLDGGISLPLYWLRPYDTLVIGGEEFQNINVEVLGWTWNAGGRSIKVEANVQEADIIKLLSQVA